MQEVAQLQIIGIGCCQLAISQTTGWLDGVNGIPVPGCA